MKLKQTFISLYIIAILCALTTNLNAQVTIGSAEKPVGGALLDLKDGGTYSNDETAVKGLGMPRVELTSTSDLFPMFEKDGVGYKDAVKTDEDQKHVGLCVYNTNTCLTSEGFEAGLYVWDGSQWQWINKPKPSAEVKTFKDSRSGGTYHYRAFGNAGEWMLENLRETSYDTHSNAYGDVHGNSSLGLAASVIHRKWCYPNTHNNNATYVKDRTMGLLYSWASATGRILEAANHGLVNERQTTLNTQPPGVGEVEGQGLKYQGICPNGWHIPSDREWNMLREELATKSHLYSHIPTASWDPSWVIEETGVFPAGEVDDEHGRVGASACPMPDSNVQVSDIEGKSYSMTNGGFDSKYPGYLLQSAPAGAAYGSSSYFWSASLGEAFMSGTVTVSKSWAFTFDRINSGVYRATHTRGAHFSVRCKKD